MEFPKHVYPGHPVEIGLRIMAAFPNFQTASSKGGTFQKALESQDVPGAGGAVHTAMAVLERVQKGEVTPEAAFDHAGELWDNARSSDFAHRRIPGTESVLPFRDAFCARLREWTAHTEIE